MNGSIKCDKNNVNNLLIKEQSDQFLLQSDQRISKKNFVLKILHS